DMRRKSVLIAMLGGTVVLGGTSIPLVSHARAVAEDHMRLARLQQIGGAMQRFADTRTNGRIEWPSVMDQLRAEDPDLLAPFKLHDGSSVSYEFMGPSDSIRGVEPSKVAVVRDVVQGHRRPSAVLYGDGHVTLEE